MQRNFGKTMLSTLCGAICAIALSNAVSVQADYQDDQWTIAAQTREVDLNAILTAITGLAAIATGRYDWLLDCLEGGSDKKNLSNRSRQNETMPNAKTDSEET
jgi:hypothetical protein